MNKRLYIGLLFGILFLNFFDCLTTVIVLGKGIAYETNALMAYAYDKSPYLFVFVKTFIVLFGSLWLFKGIERKSAKFGIWLIFLIYTGIVIYEFYHLLRLSGLVA